MKRSIPSVSCQQRKTMFLLKNDFLSSSLRERSQITERIPREMVLHFCGGNNIELLGMALRKERHLKVMPAAVPWPTWNKHDCSISIFRGNITGEVEWMRMAGKHIHYPAPLSTSWLRDHVLESTSSSLGVMLLREHSWRVWAPLWCQNLLRHNLMLHQEMYVFPLRFYHQTAYKEKYLAQNISF